MALLLAWALGCGPASIKAEGGDRTRTTSGEPGYPAGLLVLDAVTVVDVQGAREHRAVLVSEGRIYAEIASGGAWPPDAEVHQGGFVVPGLVDAHVHLAHSATVDWVGDTLAWNLRASLWHGVTSVMDVGGPTSLFEVRDAIAAGEMIGPELLATGPFLTAEGSHPCELSPDPDLCVFVTAGDAALAAEALREAGADAIKVALADAAFTDWPTPRLDPAAITEAAGILPVIAHVDSDADVVDAVAAGVSVLAHPPFAGPIGEAARAAAGAVAVHTTVGAFAAVGEVLEGRVDPQDPTLLIPQETRESWAWVQDHPEVLAPGWAEASAEWAESARANLGVLLSDGVTLLPGSDAGYYFVAHGTGLHAELRELAALGMEPEAVLVAATWGPRQALGLEGGQIAAGEPADLLVLASDPRLDVAALDDIRLVVRAGTSWSRDALADLDMGHPAELCLEPADCADPERCDAVTRRCGSACPDPWATSGACDASSWCMPEDGDDAADGVCHEETGCDLYAQDCQPAFYGEACVPLDVDTNTCWPAGPRGEGQRCSAEDPALRCEAGSFCSALDGRCWRLCDPDADPDAGQGCGPEQRCWLQRAVAGEPWFGVCE